MAHSFKLNSESIKREYAVYVVIIKYAGGCQLYIGKTGDNRDGCNPIISRCGNHFSYNKIHSQIRNKTNNHEDCEYEYVFDHFGQYIENDALRMEKVDLINEMERWLNKEIQRSVMNIDGCEVVNPFKGAGHISKKEQLKRFEYRNESNSGKIASIVETVVSKIEC